MNRLRTILILLISIFFAQSVRADVCDFVSQKTALKAVNIIEKEHEIIYYCELCNDAKMVSKNVNEVNYKKVDEKNFEVLLNGKNIDLAYIYIKKSNSYDNLAFLSGCDEAKKYNITASRKDFPIKKETTKADISLKSKVNAQAVLKKCMEIAFAKENLSTYDFLIASENVNGCLVNAIKKEIEKGFEVKEQDEMLQNLKQSRKAVFAFYDKIYNSNKYCIGQCGATAQIFPYEDEAKLLQQMLERLIFLNLAKKGD